MTIDDTLAAIAAYAKLAKFPWAELEAQGKGLLQSDAYIGVLEERFNQYFQVIWRLDIPELRFGGVSADQARGAVEDLKAAIAARSGKIFDAIASGNPLLAIGDAVSIPADVLRMAIVINNAVTWADFSGHDSGAWAWAVVHGRASLEEAKASAQDCYRLWTVIIDLDKAGVLEPLKRPEFKKPTAGLGAAPIAAGALVAIVVAVVLVVAIIAWLVVTLTVEAHRVQMIEQTCFDEHGKLLSPAPDHCKKYLDNIAQDPNAHLTAMFKPLTDALSSAVKGFFGVVGVGVLLYIGAVYVLPAVTQAMKKKGGGAELAGEA
jgi:hypothetical protein